jgi:hypothetical protein
MRWQRKDRVPVSLKREGQDMPTITNGGFLEDWVLVGPELAEEFLESNRDNRRLVTARVLRFAEDMEAKRWKNYHPHGISFDWDGRLVDGQHRLAAIALSGASIIMRVTRGLDPAMHAVFDLGAARMTGDVLRRGGVNNATHAGTIASMLYLYDNYPDVLWHNPRYPSKTYQLEFATEHNAALQEAIHAAQQIFRTSRIPRSAYGVLYMLVDRYGMLDDWDDWHGSLLTGAGLQKGDPRLTLRNYFSHQDRARDGQGIWARQRNLAVVLKAYRYYKEGKPVKLLRFNKSELPMPSIYVTSLLKDR